MNRKIMIIISKGTSLRRMQPDLNSVNTCSFAINMEVKYASRTEHLNVL
jgi:hypothetical protein